MEIGLLIKDYSDCKAKLLSSLSYVIKCSSDLNDTFSEFFIDDYEVMLALLQRIYTDIKDINIAIEALRRIEKSQYLKN